MSDVLVNDLKKTVGQKQSSKSPMVRFDGFTDDWEQSKLGEVTESYSGGTPSAGNKSYYGGQIPFIRSAEINSDKTELFLTDDGLNNSSAKMVEAGNILYALYGATSGEVGISQINGAINQAILAIKTSDGYNSQFIMQWLRLQKQKIIDKYLQGGQGNLSGSIVKELQIEFPIYDEQAKIGTFFEQLDNTIDLHQRKLDILSNTKQTFLQKMFPKKGSSVPEIRFDGFTDDWEECKLGDVLSKPDLEKVNVVSKNELMTLSLNLNGLTVGSRQTLELGSTVYYKRKSGQLIYGKQNIFKGSLAIISDDFDGLATSGDVPSLDIMGKVDASFIYTFMSRESWYSLLEIYASGTGSKRLHEKELLNVDVKLPSLEEQQKIGSFFNTMDDRIESQQTKIKQLQEMKNALLQRMFV